jgi:hypothetical protein
MTFRIRLALFLIVSLALLQIVTAVLVYEVTRRQIIGEGEHQLALAGTAFVRQLDDISARVGDNVQVLTLEAPGVVAVGCNIHDGMISYLYVSDAPWMARSGADGRVRFDGLPAGEYDVQVWHPRLPPMGAPPGQTGVALAADARPTLTFSLRLLPDLRRPGNHEQTHY